VLLLLLLVRLGSGDTRPRSAPPGAPEGSPAWPWDLRASRSASADGGCAGRSCQGRDPYREGCDRDSVTVHALSADGRTLRLRYSPVCRTVWAEVDPAGGTEELLAAAAGAATQTAARGATRTAMVAADQHRARACVVVAGRQLGVTEHDSWIGPVHPSHGEPRLVPPVVGERPLPVHIRGHMRVHIRGRRRCATRSRAQRQHGRHRQHRDRSRRDGAARHAHSSPERPEALTVGGKTAAVRPAETRVA
ncbi:DUF2690 domain-containing protein, partial [Streptomyces sp. MCAF7]